MASQIDIAKRLGLSQRSVSAALAGKMDVSEATKKRVREIAEKIGYRPNAAARAMVSRRTRNIGVVVWAQGGTPISLHETELVSGVHDVLEPGGYTTCLIQMGDIERSGDGIKRVFTEQMLDGMVICCGLQKAIRDRIGSLTDKVVWCDAGVRDATNCLWRDDRLAGELAGQAVMQAGYRKIVWVHQTKTSGPERTYTYYEERLAGLVATTKGCKFSDFAILPELGMPWRQLAEQLDSKTVVVACSYGQATIVSLMAAAAGLVAGRDFAMVCCDELKAWEYHWPNLPRSSFDRFGMGRQAAEMMLACVGRAKRAEESRVIKPFWIDGHDAQSGMPSTLPKLNHSS
jgi:DNA-binding LacI/PurR family transcriptional regulator